ncbi:MAG TPA: endonuclease/exonuclease/phosphatase family protein [Micavibrio sp.]|nr:endonuclease/exonuclease/phosphatase family protein [Micavibrio sp.]
MGYKDFFPEIFRPADSLQIYGGCNGCAFGPTIRVLVWNMYKARSTGWSEDFQTYIQNKELVILQEAVINTNHDMIFQSPGRFEWIMAKTHKSRTTQATTGVKTGSIVKSTAHAYFMTSDVEPILKTPKMLLASTYPVEGMEEQLLVVNIHAINFVSFQKFSRQLKQMVEAIEKHRGPVILAGDFNTWNDLRYRSLLDVADRMGLQEAQLMRKGRLAHLNKHLDHVFYRGLDIVQTEVLMAVRSSDHYPIVVEFVIPGVAGSA